VNPWFGKGVFLAGMVAFIAIRAPHAHTSRQKPVAESRKGRVEELLLALMTFGFLLLPLVYVFTPVLHRADYPLTVGALTAGVICLIASEWLFYRSHADLGSNWSVTLELREGQALVTSGIYRRVRHPMYTSIFLYGVAQALLLPNWIAGPSCLAAFTLMFVARLGPEERMMEGRFGREYREYRARSKRLIPGVW
jgi:protein-S-isoprenylcysteine O-methyltransferase Ste14